MSVSISQAQRAETAINNVVSLVQDVIDSQSNATIAELQTLEHHNRKALRRYEDMNQAAEGLAADHKFLQDNNQEIERYVKQLDDISDEVTRLERLVQEMNEWSKELAVKVKRL